MTIVGIWAFVRQFKSYQVHQIFIALAAWHRPLKKLFSNAYSHDDYSGKFHWNLSTGISVLLTDNHGTDLRSWIDTWLDNQNTDALLEVQAEK